MARFKGEGRNIDKLLGSWICRLAGRVAAGGLAAAQQPDFDPGLIDKDVDPERGVGVARTDEFCDGLDEKIKFDESITSAVEQAKRAQEAAGGGDITYVQFHFDRTIKTSDGGGTIKIVNVAIPDLSSKLVLENGRPTIGDDGEPNLDLKSVAEEAFGLVAYRTCQN